MAVGMKQATSKVGEWGLLVTYNGPDPKIPIIKSRASLRHDSPGFSANHPGLDDY